MEPKKNGRRNGPNGQSFNHLGMQLSSDVGRMQQSETTGRFLVMMRPEALDAGIQALSDKVGLKHIANAADFAEGAVTGQDTAGADAIVFDKLAVVIADAEPEQLRSLATSVNGESSILAIEPERVVYAIQQPYTGGTARFRPPPLNMPSEAPAWGGMSDNLEQGIPLGYLQGYRDAVNRLVDQMLVSAGLPSEIEEEEVAAWNETEVTWGLQATRAAMSRFSGKGVRVAVLDTGFDLEHPDFAGRKIHAQSFVEGEQAQDGHGHGTHCIGTACGPLQPNQLPRYGVAYESEIFAGKVLSNAGSGSDGGILAGINWAISSRCHIVSMSLGARVVNGQGFSHIFEEVAQRALKAGTLIIAAAGNDSRRPQIKFPVSHPANCPSIMAVGALDPQMGVTFFSNAGLNPLGGQIDIAAPGLDVISSWPSPQLYNRISGTSMATPHVAGIAALLAEANPGMRGRNLASLLMQSARRLNLPAVDVGSGLVQAP